MNIRFNRQEIAGSIADLGVIVPLTCSMVFINRLDPTAIFVVIGAFYILSGLYFRVPIPVEPMKVIAAYAISSTLSAERISLAALCMGIVLIILGGSNVIALLVKIVPKSCVRGVQLTTGILLFIQGVKFILGKSAFQRLEGKAEPFLSLQTIGPIPIGIIFGVIAVILIFYLLDNNKVPAALTVITLGSIVGLALGGWRRFQEIHIGFYLPRFIPYNTLKIDNFFISLTTLVLPQLPMTVSNAIIAQSDLTHEYFCKEVGRRSTCRAFSISMGIANIAAGMLSCFPLCHGAGGMAAHYRFGARTAGANIFIGALFLASGFLLGKGALILFSLIPFSILGTLLCFTGAQLSMMIIDIRDKKELFVTLSILGIALSTNLGWGFGVGILLAYFFKYTRINI